MTYDEIADRLIDWATAHPRVRGLWIEADAVRHLRRPYAGLELHAAADEPDFPAVVAEIEHGLVCLGGARPSHTAVVPRFAKEHHLDVGGLAFTLVIEQSYLLAKRPRAEVVPLVDKTGHLTHVMDFSRRRPATSPAANKKPS